MFGIPQVSDGDPEPRRQRVFGFYAPRCARIKQDPPSRNGCCAAIIGTSDDHDFRRNDGDRRLAQKLVLSKIFVCRSAGSVGEFLGELNFFFHFSIRPFHLADFGNKEMVCYIIMLKEVTTKLMNESWSTFSNSLVYFRWASINKLQQVQICAAKKLLQTRSRFRKRTPHMTKKRRVKPQSFSQMSTNSSGNSQERIAENTTLRSKNYSRSLLVYFTPLALHISGPKGCARL